MMNEVLMIIANSLLAIIAVSSIFIAKYLIDIKTTIKNKEMKAEHDKEDAKKPLDSETRYTYTSFSEYFDDIYNIKGQLHEMQKMKNEVRDACKEQLHEMQKMKNEVRDAWIQINILTGSSVEHDKKITALENYVKKHESKLNELYIEE